MLTFEQAWADQSDLAALCAHRPAAGCLESFWCNLHYGAAHILKAYSGWPMERPLPCVIPHGVYTNDAYLHPAEPAAPLPAIFAFPEYLARLWAKHSRKLIIPGASPLLYAKALLEYAPRADAAGSIFFPVHSTTYAGVRVDGEALAAALLRLDRSLHPVTICLHWSDLNQPPHEAFQRAGFRCVSAGHINDPEFLFRWLHLLSSHKFAGSNGHGSSMFYALALGTPWFFTGPRAVSLLSSHCFPDYLPPSAEMLDTVEKFELLYRDSEEAPLCGPLERALSGYFLGAENLKSPTALHSDFESAHLWALGRL